MPAPETIDFEREFAEIVRELRAVPSEAPRELRERVRELGEPAPRRSARLPRLSRRTLLVLAPACVLAVVAAAVVRGIVVSSTSHPKVEKAAVHGAAARGHVQALGAMHRQRGIFTPSTTLSSGPAYSQSLLPAPNPARYQNYQASLRVRVHDLKSLGEQTAAAMQITQQLGGYVASVSQATTSGAPGEADLVLRVPVAHVQAAMIKLSALGTVLDQNVSIQDLNAAVNAQRQQILQLKIQIARIEAALQQPLSVADRLQLEFQLGNAKRNLANVTGANAKTLREAAMSRIQLSLTTEKAIVTKHHSSFLGRATHSAVTFLGDAGVVALAALIVLSPFLALAALWVLGMRGYRRREERRLLAAS